MLGMVTSRRRNEVFLAFPDLLDANVPATQVIYLVLDNLNTHPGAHIETWRVAHPRDVHRVVGDRGPVAIRWVGVGAAILSSAG